MDYFDNYESVSAITTLVRTIFFILITIFILIIICILTIAIIIMNDLWTLDICMISLPNTQAFFSSKLKQPDIVDECTQVFIYRMGCSE